MKLTFFAILIVSCFALFCAKGLKEEFSWTRISYDWPRTRTSRQVDVESRSRGNSYRRGGSYNRRPTGRPADISFPGSTNAATAEEDTEAENAGPGNIPYTYENNVPMGANVWKNKLFITVPRRRLGVPSSLNFVWINGTTKHNAPLIPYPDWNTNILDQSGGSRRRGSTKIVSVYRVAVDPCDRLWFVDTGTIETLGNPTQVQPAALVIMDLKTDRIIHRHVFNSSVIRAAPSLASVTVDTTKRTCDNAYAYIPDLGGYGLVVFSLKDNRAWRVTHNYFYLEPMAGEFSIGGHNFQWNDGIFSVALSDVKSDGSRDAYFHSMAGTHLYRVSTNILRDEALATRSYHGNDFESVGDRGPQSQTSASAIHQPTGVLFLNLVNQNALGCWNTNKPLSDISIVQKDNRKMIYPSDVKIYGDEVILLTNNMPIFLYGRLNYDETNFRVWSQKVSKAIEGTKCATNT